MGLVVTRGRERLLSSAWYQDSNASSPSEVGSGHLEFTLVFACRYHLTQSEDTSAHGRVASGGWGQKPTCVDSRSESSGFHRPPCLLTTSIIGVARVLAKHTRPSPQTATLVTVLGCGHAEMPGPGHTEFFRCHHGMTFVNLTPESIYYLFKCCLP